MLVADVFIVVFAALISFALPKLMLTMMMPNVRCVTCKWFLKCSILTDFTSPKNNDFIIFFFLYSAITQFVDDKKEKKKGFVRKYFHFYRLLFWLHHTRIHRLIHRHSHGKTKIKQIKNLCAFSRKLMTSNFAVFPISKCLFFFFSDSNIVSITE